MRDVRDLLREGVAGVRPEPDALDRTLRRIDARRRNRRIVGAVTALALGLGALVLVWTAFRPASAPAPAASPTGTIVFATQGPGDMTPFIAVMNDDGSDVGRLAPGDEPALSPDGTRIAFVRTTESGNGIWVMNVDGSGQIQLTVNADGLDESPTWSPDGTRIAFDRSTEVGEPRRIYAMASDGSDLRALTSEGWDRFGPAWSPDGTTIAFVTAGPGIVEASNAPTQVWLMDEDGTHETQLTTSAVGAWRPAWSPDGSRLAFDDAGSSIYVVDADGTGVHAVGPEGGYDPSWSPDGTRIAFTNGSDADGAIFAMNLEGGDVRRLTEAGVNDVAPSWGPRPELVPPSTTRCTAARTSGDFDGDGTVDEAAFVEVVPSGVSCVREGAVFANLLAQEIEVRFGSGQMLDFPFTDCRPCLTGGLVFAGTDLDGDGRAELAVDVGPGAAVDYVELYRVDPDGIRPLTVSEPGDPPYVQPGPAILGGGFDAITQSPIECRVADDGSRELISYHWESLGDVSGPWTVHTTTMILEGDRLVVTSTSDERRSLSTTPGMFQDRCR